MANSWKMNVGVNHAPAYQVSGRPYASGGIDALTPAANGTVLAAGEGVAQKVAFPYVTRWVVVTNDHVGAGHQTGNNLVAKVAFSQEGILGTEDNYYFNVASGSTSGRLELKVSEIWLSGSNNMSVVAGLTTILPRSVASGSAADPSNGVFRSWSGSAGVG